MGKFLKKLLNHTHSISGEDLLAFHHGKQHRRYFEPKQHELVLPENSEEALKVDMMNIGGDLKRVIEKQKQRLLNV